MSSERCASVESAGLAVEVRRLGGDDAPLGVNGITLRKAPDGWPTPPAACLSTSRSRDEKVLIVAMASGGPPVGYLVTYLLDSAAINRARCATNLLEPETERPSNAENKRQQ